MYEFSIKIYLSTIIDLKDWTHNVNFKKYKQLKVGTVYHFWGEKKRLIVFCNK